MKKGYLVAAVGGTTCTGFDDSHEIARSHEVGSRVLLAREPA